jgi:hypothetical protein
MRMPSPMTAAVAAATLISPSVAHATIRLANDPGGLIAAYQHRFDRARRTGEHIVIDGSCLSACTLAVGLVPREQVCATPKAVLGFHAAWQPTPYGGKVASVGATHHMMSIYPTQLKSWINAHGGLTPRMIFLKGDELTSIVAACSEADITAARAVKHNTPSRRSRSIMARGPRFHPVFAVRRPTRMYY